MVLAESPPDSHAARMEFAARAAAAQPMLQLLLRDAVKEGQRLEPREIVALFQVQPVQMAYDLQQQQHEATQLAADASAATAAAAEQTVHDLQQQLEAQRQQHEATQLAADASAETAAAAAEQTVRDLQQQLEAQRQQHEDDDEDEEIHNSSALDESPAAVEAAASEAAAPECVVGSQRCGVLVRAVKDLGHCKLIVAQGSVVDFSGSLN